MEKTIDTAPCIDTILQHDTPIAKDRILTTAEDTPSPAFLFLTTYQADTSEASVPFVLDESEELGSTMFSEPLSVVSTSSKPLMGKKEQVDAAKEEEEEEGELPSTLNSTKSLHQPPLYPLPSNKKRKNKQSSLNSNPKKSKQKKNQSKTRENHNKNDIWDDTLIIEAWNKGIEKYRKQQRGEPVSDSEQEKDEDDDGVEEESENETCLVSENTDQHEETTTEAEKKTSNPLFPPSATTTPSACDFSDAELLEHISTSWYWAGYYMGMYKERQRSSTMQL